MLPFRSKPVPVLILSASKARVNFFLPGFSRTIDVQPLTQLMCPRKNRSQADEQRHWIPYNNQQCLYRTKRNWYILRVTGHSPGRRGVGEVLGKSSAWTMEFRQHWCIYIITRTLRDRATQLEIVMGRYYPSLCCPSPSLVWWGLQSFQPQGESLAPLLYRDPYNKYLYRGSVCQSAQEQHHRGHPTVPTPSSFQDANSQL